MSPEEVGADNMELILTARSGRHAFKHAVERMGFEVNDAVEFEQLFNAFLSLPDSKKEVYDHHPTATVILERNDEEMKGSASALAFLNATNAALLEMSNER